MQGGGYILSRNLVAQVAAREEEPPEHLPEDAIVARMIGSDKVRSCMCSDTRNVKEAYSFQNIDLFKNSGYPPSLPPSLFIPVLQIEVSGLIDVHLLC